MIQWRDLNDAEQGALKYVVGLLAEEDFHSVHETLLKSYRDVLPGMVNKGLLTLDRDQYDLGPEGKRLAMLYRISPRFRWSTG